jgi:hypothetical protein
MSFVIDCSLFINGQLHANQYFGRSNIPCLRFFFVSSSPPSHLLLSLTSFFLHSSFFVGFLCLGDLPYVTPQPHNQVSENEATFCTPFNILGARQLFRRPARCISPLSFHIELIYLIPILAPITPVHILTHAFVIYVSTPRP